MQSVVQKYDCIHVPWHRTIKGVEEEYKDCQYGVNSSDQMAEQQNDLFLFLGCYGYHEIIPNCFSSAIRIYQNTVFTVLWGQKNKSPHEPQTSEFSCSAFYPQIFFTLLLMHYVQVYLLLALMSSAVE